jgi:peptidyl-tRNA hydrolase, PTH1 family
VKLIVGLGNPGIEYQFTPHNMGFLAVDRLADECKVRVANRHCRALTGKAVIEGQDALLAKPETFMNLSGIAVRGLVDEYEVDPVQDLIVLYDELDLPFGHIRVRPRGSSAGHNGIESIIGALGSEEFIRVRMGINPGRPLKEGAPYLLSPIKRSQEEAAAEMIDAAADAVKVILTEGVLKAMNRFNRKAESAEKSE